jgi:hypothetical protein
VDDSVAHRRKIQGRPGPAPRTPGGGPDACPEWRVADTLDELQRRSAAAWDADG